mmetsp:Transcript_83549/g.255339  ORF Transcript_83549/g.255339 Transcript_83549/m.255339 type:complete len:203 (+) Transcript_83549:1975-2583(+)
MRCIEIAEALDPGTGRCASGKAAASVSSRRTICGKLTPRPRIFEANQGDGSSSQIMANCTEATTEPAVDVITTVAGDGEHSPFTMAEQVTEPVPSTVGCPEPCASTWTSETETLVRAGSTKAFSGMEPQSNCEIWSRYSTVPQLTCGEVSTSWAFTEIFTWYFLLKSVSLMPITRNGYTVSFFMPEALEATPPPSRLIVTFM